MEINEAVLSSTELERAFIGCLLDGLISLNKAIVGVSDDCLVHDTTRTIWMALKASNKLVSNSQILEYGKERGIIIKVSDIGKMRLEAKNADPYMIITKLNDYEQRRYMAKKVSDLTKSIMSLDVPSIETAGKIKKIGDEAMKIGVSSVPTRNIFDTVHDIRKRMDGEEAPLLASGLRSLDDSFGGGWELGTLNVIGARSGSGKTAFAMFALRNGFKAGRKVGFISMEMTPIQYERRELSMETKVAYNKMKQGTTLDETDYKRIVLAAQQLNEHNYPRSYCGNVTPERLYSEVLKMVFEHGVQYIFIDYLQRLQVKDGKGANIAWMLAQICSSLKGLCIEHNVCIILLSQLNRSSSSGGHKRKPNMTDLRDSGGIEENMDTITLMYKPLEKPDGTINDNLVEFINEKNRDGESGEIVTSVTDLGINMFYDYNHGESAPF